MDYKADKMQSQFIFNNPNQTGACGCGESVQLTAAKLKLIANCAFRESTAKRERTMDRDFLIDLFADFGPVTIRRMFSGYGISVDGVNFALALRAVSISAPTNTTSRNSRPSDRAVPVSEQEQDGHGNSYWQLPARLFDDRGVGWLGEGGAISRPARGAAQARPKAEEDRGKKG